MEYHSGEGTPVSEQIASVWRDPEATPDRIQEFEDRLIALEKKMEQAEKAYFNFMRNAENNPVLRMALKNFGLIHNDSPNG